MDVGRHPAFIGRATFERCADNGGALLYELNGLGVAASLINPHLGILNALNVVPEHRGHGLGGAIVCFLLPNFVRAIEDKVPFFQRLGYRAVGQLKRGQSLNTQVMAREALFSLAGRLGRALQKSRADRPVVEAEAGANCAGQNQRGRKTMASRNARRSR